MTISIKRSLSYCVSLALAIATLIPIKATQAQELDPEWPCVQQLISEVSPAVMWPVPVDDNMRTQYRDDPQLRSMAEELGDIETFTETHQQEISEFANGISESERKHKLTLLASGIVDVSNRIRKNYISGIKRYTRQQIAISEQIENSLNELSALDGQATQDTQARQDVKDTLRWHERIYDQRERSIQLLCEEPVELEQQLSEVLRYTAQYLP